MPFNRAGTMKAIHALGSKHGYNHDDIRDLAASQFGIDRKTLSLGKLTDTQLIALCGILRGDKQTGPAPISNGITDKQIYKIKAQEKELGWSDNPKRLAGFVQRQAKKDSLNQLTKWQAVKVIDGLKNLIERGTTQEQ